MIKVLNSSLERLGTIKQVDSASRFEELNGENTLDFSADLDDVLKNVIDEYSIFEVNNDYFDIAKFTKNVNDDDTITIEVESEHVSYRLNREQYNVDYFTEEGTPSYILGKILIDTDFTVDFIERTDVVTYSAQEQMSRRRLLMEFVAYIGGEIEFDKFSISIHNQRGRTVQQPLVKGKNVTVVGKVVNKREKNSDGNPLISYKCTPIYMPGDDYSLGDAVRLIQQDLGINESFRLVSITSNPYDSSKVTFQLANYVNGLEDRLYRIETTTVAKDKIYNGTRIGPEFGFEAIRSDNKARAHFSSDEMVFQSGDGSGEVWRDRLKYVYDDEHDETTLEFDGKLTVGAIDAIKAEIDVVVSNTTITNVLSAQTGYIAQLTVDELETSDKVKRYLVTDPSDCNYVKIKDQIVEYITASTTGTETEQVRSRALELMYWLDATHTGMTADPIGHEPVLMYKYTELVKMRFSFKEMPDDPNMVATIELGAGTGDPTGFNGKGFIYKGTNEFVIRYYTGSGVIREIKMNDAGITTIPPIGGGGSADNIFVLPSLPTDLTQYSEGDIILIPYV